MEVDALTLPAALEATLEESRTLLLKKGNLTEAISHLVPLEKQTRLSADISGNSRILVEMVSLCFEAGDLVELDNVVNTFSKKRGIIRQSVTSMIQKCVALIPSIEDSSRRHQLIETVRVATEGKIYVEVEHARVTRILADMHEKAGNLREAAQVMQELQVETFGSLEKREKVEFILEQMRLSIIVKEFQKALLMSRKVNSKTFEHDGFEDLKVRYLELMIQLMIHEKKYIDCCKYYRSILESKSIQEDPVKSIVALKMAVIFAILAPFNNEQNDLMNILYGEKRIDQLPLYREFLRTFLTKELVRWPVVEKAFGNELSEFSNLFGTDEHGKERWHHLFERVVEHNIRTISGFYSQIGMKRFAQLLELCVDVAEQTLSKLVAQNMIYAKIDRTTFIITFSPPKAADEVLNSWNSRVESLLSLMVKTNHQIAKEEMVHAALLKTFD